MAKCAKQKASPKGATKGKQYVFFFGGGKAEGDGTMKPILGGKGAGLSEMTSIGLPVPPGFVITTEVCKHFYENGKKYPDGLKEQVDAKLAQLEKVAGKKFGDPKDPLLVSVRSGAAVSMPGMMETILNLGLNDASVEGIAERSGNRRFALDAYRRLIMMYGSTAMGMERELYDHAFAHIKKTMTAPRLGLKEGDKIEDTMVNEQELEALIGEYKKIYKQGTGQDFPQCPMEQLWGSVNAVFGSWMAPKAVTYRSVEKITGLLGTAVNCQQMVFGNVGEKSGTGVAFTRDPSNGANIFYGDYLYNAQGEDVVAGIRDPIHLDELKKTDAKIYAQLCGVRKTLEKYYHDMQDIEFTVQDGKLFMLQTRRGKRTPQAAFKIAADMVKEKLITKEDAVARITEKDIQGLFYPIIDPKISPMELKRKRVAGGVDAVPGAASGQIAFSAPDAEAEAKKGKKVILVRHETSPEDVGGMYVAQGILTATGGKTSHAAVVARGWGKTCVCGCSKLNIDYKTKTMIVGEKTYKEGDWITLNGTTGEVFDGQMSLVAPEPPPEFKLILSWADKIRRLKIRTNADTPLDARKARELGAEGIGLCRTEHMFFKDFEIPEDSEKRQLAIQEMILSETQEDRKKALQKLLPFQRRDFVGIFKAMNGLPVTIRLIDPPLHEFVPKSPAEVEKLSKATGITPETIDARSDQLHEANPMLGHRGCRLAVTYPEILEMQVRAIIEAAIICAKAKVKVMPEIMIPVVMDPKEYKLLDEQTRAVAAEVMKEQKTKVDYMVGTMIELPRAALLADKIAENAEFFSFGTNDLTQTTCGLSRDDAGSFLPAYTDEKGAAILKADPFEVLDQDGVGQLVKMGLERGRAGRAATAKAAGMPDKKAWLKVGICGEHGGEPKSVGFCHRIGMDYVSCSPLRVPIARLAAAQAVVAEGAAKTAPAKKAAPSKKAAKKK
ncbi:MAG TPA: pyruvate, phosphate dikinase [Candidatus Brocadiia bacterium]|nr:pyruvate, phosphate dikinase [Candidatus Brocadiia bacterium]